MTNIITIRDKIGIDQIVEIEEFHLVVEFSVHKITGTDQGMNKQQFRYSYIRSKRNVGNIRSKVDGLLQNKIRHITAKFEQRL